MAIASVLRQPIEFEQQVFLFAIQVDRCFHFDLAVKISLRFGPHIADAFPRRRKIRSDWLSGGIFRLARPSRVGMSISPPRAAVARLSAFHSTGLSPSG
ncbi:MAG: hypothetical protein CM1200mP20_17280 [Pseudomonadota bacterium]|nr:MAG: hypothetical protein CM1200mP20_17280 [Pseudomonadota bacterium]